MNYVTERRVFYPAMERGDSEDDSSLIYKEETYASHIVASTSLRGRF